MKIARILSREFVCLGSAWFALVAGAALAQRPGLGETCTVQGVVHASGFLGPGYSVELQSSQRKMSVLGTRAAVEPTGAFRILDAESGQAILVVRNPQGTVVYQRFIAVSPSIGEIWIELREERKDRPVDGTVSVTRLRHKVPSKAVKEFTRAEDAFKKGDVQRSIDYLDKAVEIDPEYMEAHNNLGSRYLQLEQYDKAIEHFQNACKLDPGAALPQLNLGAALLLSHKPGDAEQSARRAKDLDPRSAWARYILALALLEQNKKFDEAVGLLRQIASDIPRAHLLAARALAVKGDNDQARQEAEKYLASGKAEDRDKVETWMTALGGAPRAANATSGN